uniref:Uncharacterized protein n=1 Tax=Rhizophora mucronata TaxID=61149 RepID=A0A2P2NGV9_RHIMU
MFVILTNSIDSVVVIMLLLNFGIGSPFSV